MGNELDQTRLAALNQAAHDLRGAESAEDTVKRAEVYLAFLSATGRTMVLGEPPLAPHPLAQPQGLTAAQTDHMVQRFLSWSLPPNFNPDGGISFMPHRSVPIDKGVDELVPNKPTGTNLFDRRQATQMVRFMIEGLPA